MDKLKIFPFFSQLSMEKKKEFFSLLTPIYEKKGSIIHYQGDICKNSLLLISGEVRLYSQDSDFSDEVTLYTLKSGEQCLSKIIEGLNNTIAIPTAVAETDIEGYLVNREDIESFIAKTPEYQEFIILLYAKKVVDLTLALQQMKFKNLDERILDFLYKNQKNNIVTITHDKLSEKMYTSRTVVSRVLKKLEEDEKVKLYRGFIEVIK